MINKIRVDLNWINPVKIIIDINKIQVFFKKKKFLKYYIKLSIFYKLNLYLNYLNVNKSLFFYITYNYYKIIYNLNLNALDLDLYYNFLCTLLINYYQILDINFYELNNNQVFNNNFVFYPNSILININLKLSAEMNYSPFYIYKFEKYLFKKLLILKKNYKNDIYNEIKLKSKYYYDMLIKHNYSYQHSKFKLNFLRVQRRYNKRRYSKVRVSSRNSFFAGISLSSILIAILWGGSIKKTDWLTAKIVVIDINLIIFTFILYFMYRLYIIYNPSIFIRKKNKIRILNTLQNLFILNIWFNN